MCRLCDPRKPDVPCPTRRDFLKATVLLSAGCATLLATLAVLGITREDDRVLLGQGEHAVGVEAGGIRSLRPERERHDTRRHDPLNPRHRR